MIVFPQDLILTELLSNQKDWIVGYHEHDSLLEKRPDENLSEEERLKAWEEYERDKKGLYQYRGMVGQPTYHVFGNTPFNNNLNMVGGRPMMPMNTQLPTFVRPIIRTGPLPGNFI